MPSVARQIIGEVRQNSLPNHPTICDVGTMIAQLICSFPILLGGYTTTSKHTTK